jgi:hypothetical protein
MGDPARDTEPPLEPFEEDESNDEGARDDFGELLPGIAEDEPNEDDDSAPAATERFDLDVPLDDDTLDEQTSPDLKFGTDSVLPEEDDGGSGDATGLEGQPTTGSDAPEDELPPDDEERDGIDERSPLVSDRDLPGLDGDLEGAEEDGLLFGSFAAAREVRLPSADVPWRVETLAAERASALSVAAGAVVAGSTELLWLERGRTTPVRLALDGARIVGLALLGAEQELALAVTAAGKLLRRARLASDAERVGELGPNAELGGETPGVVLAAVGTAAPRSVVTALVPGHLSRSDDAGALRATIEPELRVAALSSTASPLVAVLAGGRELALSDDGGQSFERSKLAGYARGVAEGEAPLVAAEERVVVIADAERGVVVSSDRGRTFREVPGGANVTACAAGFHGGRPRAFLALYTEATDTTQIALVDAEDGTAQIVAVVAGPGDDDVLPASARITALGWDGERLFAVGEPGFILLEPPGTPARR